jgi:Zn-dependent M16 (insulinase) family peptidase
MFLPEQLRIQLAAVLVELREEAEADYQKLEQLEEMRKTLLQAHNGACKRIQQIENILDPVDGDEELIVKLRELILRRFPQ